MIILLKLIQLYELIIIARVVMSWFAPNPYNPVVQFIYRVTEPIIGRVRKVLFNILPNIGLDFSPFVVFLLLEFIKGIIREAAYTAPVGYY